MESRRRKTTIIWQAISFYTLLVVACTIFLVVLAAIKGNRVTTDNQVQFTSFLGQLPSPVLPAGDLVPAYAPTLGPADAPITIVEFADFECPYCRASAYPIRQLLAQYPNDVRLVYRHFPIKSVHPLAEKLALAAFCAHDQGYFWPFHDQLFSQQGSVTEESLVSVAKSVGVETNRFEACLSTRQFSKQVAQDFADAARLGARGTPTWIVNGQKIEGVLPLETWKQVVEGLLK